jgi:hypothetical protein
MKVNQIFFKKITFANMPCHNTLVFTNVQWHPTLANVIFFCWFFFFLGCPNN